MVQACHNAIKEHAFGTMPSRGIREVYYWLLIGLMTAGEAAALEPEDLKKLNSVGHCVECDLF